MTKRVVRWLMITAAFVVTLGAAQAFASFALSHEAGAFEQAQEETTPSDAQVEPLYPGEGSEAEPVAEAEPAAESEPQTRALAEAQAPEPEATEATEPELQTPATSRSAEPATAAEGPLVDYVYQYKTKEAAFLRPATWEWKSESHATIEEAFAAAEAHQSDTKVRRSTVRLNRDHTLEKDLTIPAGVILLVPYVQNDTGYVYADGLGGFLSDDHIPSGKGTTVKPELFRTLTVPANTTLTVNGTLLVNAQVGAEIGTGTNQDVSGGYGQLDLAGSLVVNEGGVFESAGYTKGAGSVEAFGGTVRDVFVAKKWRGGSAAQTNYGSHYIFPINEYYMNHIEPFMTIHSEAIYGGSMRLYVSSMMNYTNLDIVGKNAIIRLQDKEGYLTKELGRDKSGKLTGRETYHTHGDVVFANTKIPITPVVNVDTSKSLFAMTGTFDFTFEDGTVSFANSFKFLTGSTLTAKNAHVEVQKGTTLVLYNQFKDASYASFAYPVLPASVLELDDSSTLTNYGAFAGTVKTNRADAIKVGEDATSASWGGVKTKEGNQSIKNGVWSYGIQEFTFPLILEREGYDGSVGANNAIVWKGTDLTPVINAKSTAESKLAEEKKAGRKDHYTPESWQAIETAIADAQALIAENPPKGQGERVSELATKIQTAVDSLALRQFTVTFNAAGGAFANGETSQTTTVAYGSAIKSFPKDLTRDGYSFTNRWKINGTGDDVNSLSNVVEDTTLMAQWSPIAYSVTYDLGEKDAAWPEGATYPATYTAEAGFELPEPTFFGHDFVGWTVSGEGAEGIEGGSVPAGHRGNLHFKAHWTPKTIQVTYEVNPKEGETLLVSGQPIEESTHTTSVTFGESYGEMPKAQKAGWTFTSWELSTGKDTYLVIDANSVVNVDHNVTLTPHAWTLDTYQITYELGDGGTWAADTDAPPATYSVSTESFTLPTPVREGHTFMGWVRNASGKLENPATVAQGTTGTLTFSASWEVNTYTVALNAAGGAFSGQAAQESWSAAVKHNATLHNVPAVSRVGYTLRGWQVEGTGELIAPQELKTLAVTQDLTLTAQWEVISYPITYNLGEGGSWPEEAQGRYPEHYTVADTITLATPQKEGHTFAGWKVQGQNSVNVKDGVIPAGTTEALSFEAQWAVASYSITWHIWEGSDPVSVTTTAAFGAAIELPTTPERAGYRFDGWKAQERTRRASEVPAIMPAKDLTFVAQWTSYQTLLEAITNDPANLHDAEQLATARDYYNTKLNSSQKESYNASTLLSAIRESQKAEISKAIEQKIPLVNATLAPQGVGEIATLSLGEITQEGLQTVYVELKQPSYLALNMLNLPFLEELFNYDAISEDIYINGVHTAKTQIALMTEVAWAALGEDSNVAKERFMADWLYPQKDTLTVGSLSGTSVSAKIMGKETIEGVQCELGYVVRFYTQGQDYDWVEFKQITFDAQGGTECVAIEQKEGADISALAPTPTRVGYTFGGWYANPEGAGDPYAFRFMPGQSLTLYAQWSPIAYSVTFDITTGTGSVPAAIETVYDAEITLPACDANRAGYTFKGWTEGTNLYPAGATVKNLATVPGAQVQMGAYWEPVSYHVTLDAGEGSLGEGAHRTITVTYDAAYGASFEEGALPTPVREGYDFAGWYLDGKQVTSATVVSRLGAHTLHAQWNERGDTPYTLEVWQQDLEGAGHTLTYSQSKTAATNATVKAQVADITGFGLNEEASILEAPVAGDGSTTLRLVYDRNLYEITWVMGERTEQATYRFGAALEVPNPERLSTQEAAYEFVGWQNEAKELVEGIEELTVSANATYTALYNELFEASVGATTYRNLDTALAQARQGSVVTLERNVTLERDLTVPVGVTLLIPYAQDDPGYVPNYQGDPTNPSNEELRGQLGFGGDAEPYRTLTVAKGATLNVRGTVMVNALTGRPHAGNFDQDITGGWGRVVVDGRVTVGAGGTFDSFGVTEGAGSVRVLKGGTAGDLFVVKNWRGGSQAAAMYSHAVYPYNEYDCQNIKVPLTVDAGGSLEGLVKMYASGAYYTTRFPLIDPTNGLMRQSGRFGAVNDSITRTVGALGESFDVNGSATISRSTLNILGIDLSTGDFLYPIDGDISWTLRNGEFVFDEDYKFLTGASLTAQNAQVKVNAGKDVVLYQSWSDPANTGTTAYPSRPAVTLALDGSSTLTNEGTFAGKVSAQGTHVHGATGASWSYQSLEADGYYTTQPIGQEVKTLSHTLSMNAAGNTWEIARDGRILWNGQKDEAISQAIAKITHALAERLSSSENHFVVESVMGEDGTITWKIDLETSGHDKAPGVVGYEIAEKFLDAMVSKSDLVEQVSTLTNSANEVTVSTAQGVNALQVRLFAQKLGLTDASAPLLDGTDGGDKESQVGILTTPTVKDLVGRGCQILVRSIAEKGQDPEDLVIKLEFGSSVLADAPTDEPEEDKPAEDEEITAKNKEVYRLYNPFDQKHLFTTSVAEYKSLQAAGWNDEGIAWIAPATASEGTTLVTRLYNPYNHGHYYTADAGEIERLVALGWQVDSEDAQFLSAAPNEHVVHCLFNPYAERNTHIWTTDTAELDHNTTLGWEPNEGVFYAQELVQK